MRFWRALGYPCMSAIAGEAFQFSLDGLERRWKLGEFHVLWKEGGK